MKPLNIILTTYFRLFLMYQSLYIIENPGSFIIRIFNNLVGMKHYELTTMTKQSITVLSIDRSL